ncbi:hypothetical protein [Streptomyces lienomycini]|uniref:Integrase n=1 Tax=Streptomyces lienomycini TaxID=284035 RepID=A0ABV9WMI6_9ACTN|nr:hypothetical protein [Streptomyces lienomycini]
MGKPKPRTDECVGCNGWGRLAQPPYCSPCHQWRSKRHNPAAVCRRCGRDWRVNIDGFCRACVLVIIDHDADWYYDPAAAVKLQVVTQLALIVPGVTLTAAPFGAYRQRSDGRYHPPAWARAQRPDPVRDDPRICPPTLSGQLALSPAPYRMRHDHAAAIVDRPEDELPELLRVMEVLNAYTDGHACAARSRSLALRVLRLALAASRAAGGWPIDGRLIRALPGSRPIVTAVLDRAGLLATGGDAYASQTAERHRARADAPICCPQCQAWGCGHKGLCRGCYIWGARARPVGDCVRCGGGPLPLREGWCHGCLRHRALLGPAYDHVSWRQLRLTEESLDRHAARTNLCPPGRKRAKTSAQSHPSEVITPGVVPYGQQKLFPAERDWSALRRATLPEPQPEAVRLLATFDAHARAHAWTNHARKAAAHVLRIAATWLGTHDPFAEYDLRAISAATGRGSSCRPRALNAFLAERGLLLPQPRPAISSVEAFVEQVIAGYPPRIADELASWARRLRSHSDRPPTEWHTLRRYLSYLRAPLADWTGRYQTLRQVTADDVHAAVTAVKGDRAHERAVALRSIFRALKQAKIVFTDPTRGLSVTRNEPPPTTLPPDRLAGLLDITDRPAIRFALALVTLHALNGTDLNRLTLGDVISARAQLLVRRPHSRHTVHHDEVTLRLLHTWLRHRHQRWPRTANPHLFVTRQTVIHTGPASNNYFPAAFQRLGLTLNGLRTDRMLDEARDTADPVHLVRVFGISIATAMKYVHTAHPHRVGVIPR